MENEEECEERSTESTPEQEAEGRACNWTWHAGLYFRRFGFSGLDLSLTLHCLVASKIDCEVWLVYSNITTQCKGEKEAQSSLRTV
jgi:hypothetical protein